MDEPARRRIDRVRHEHERTDLEEEAKAEREEHADRQRFLGMLATLKESSIPRTEIEVLRQAIGLGRLVHETFTISEYTTGLNDPATVQDKFFVAEKHSGWFMPNVFEYSEDRDKKFPSAESLVLSEDGTTWTTAYEACGSDGGVVGVLDSDPASGSGGSDTFYPVDAIATFIERSHE